MSDPFTNGGCDPSDCASCGGGCGNCESKAAASSENNTDLIAEITKKVMQQLGK